MNEKMAVSCFVSRGFTRRSSWTRRRTSCSDLVLVAAGAVGGGHAEEGTEEGGVAVVDLCARQMTKRVLTWYARKLSKMRNLRYKSHQRLALQASIHA